MYSFEKEVSKMHKREVLSLRKELTENNEPYYQQAAESGYDNLHDYEADISAGLIKFVLFLCLSCAVFVLIV